MADFGIEITTNDGATEIKRQLNELAAGSYLREPMFASLFEIETYMKYYPPPRTFVQVTKASSLYSRTGSKRVAGRKGKYWASSYKRTGKLGQSWSTKVEGSSAELVGRVGTNLEYAPWVQKVDQQATVHQGRWHTDAQAMEQFRDKIVARFQAALERVTKK